jgi:hypothetical protein
VLLASDPTLRLQCSDTVDGGILTEAEFWAGRERLLDAEMTVQRAQRRGTSSALGADIRLAVEGSKKIFAHSTKYSPDFFAVSCSRTGLPMYFFSVRILFLNQFLIYL